MGRHRYSKNTRRFADLPHTPCVYVAELSSGMVKIGASSSARARMMSLRAELLREHGAELQRFHVVVRATIKAAYETETRIVAALASAGIPAPGRREFFGGITFEHAVSLVDAVCRGEGVQSVPRPDSPPPPVDLAFLSYVAALKARPKKAPSPKPPIAAYVEDLRAGLTLAQIAEKHGKCNASVVYAVLKKNGLPTNRRAMRASEQQATA